MLLKLRIQSISRACDAKRIILTYRSKNRDESDHLDDVAIEKSSIATSCFSPRWFTANSRKAKDGQPGIPKVFPVAMAMLHSLSRLLSRTAGLSSSGKSGVSSLEQ